MIDLCFCKKEELLKDIKIDKDKIDFKYPKRNLEKKIRKNIPLISDDLLKYYYQMAVDRQLFDLFIFKYKSIVDLKKGSFFGESSKKNLRNFTLKTLEDCHLSYIEIEIYNNFLKREKEKMNGKMLDYLYNKFFFNRINESEFHEKYFSSFVFEVKDLGYKLTEQNKKVDYIYFIKEGEISVNCVFSINLFIKNIIIPLRNHYLMKSNEKFIELMEEFEIFFKNNKSDFDSLNLTSLFIAISTSIIGLESFFFEINYLYDSIVTSSKVKYFKIEKKYLSMILRDYSSVRDIAQNEAVLKILLLIDRFIKSLKMKKQNDNLSIIYKKEDSISYSQKEKIINENNILKNEKNIENKNNNNNENNENYNNDNNLNNHSSINNTKRLNKCIINYKSKLKEKGNKPKMLLNSKMSLDEKKMRTFLIKEKSFQSLKNNNISKISCFKHNINKVNIINETNLVNLLQKNIEKNLLFSKSKNKKALSSNNSLNNGSLTLQIKPKIKLNPINDNNSLKILKNSLSTQQISLYNLEKENYKSFISIENNSINTTDGKNINDYIINQGKKISPINNVNSLNKSSKNSNKQNIILIDNRDKKSYLFQDNLSPISKDIFKQHNNIFDEKYLNINGPNNYYNYFFNSISSINILSKKKMNNFMRNKINKKIILQKIKKIKYKILKDNFYQEKFGVINDLFK